MRSFNIAYSLLALAGLVAASPVLQEASLMDKQFFLTPDLTDSFRQLLINRNPSAAPFLSFSSSSIEIIDPDSGSSHQPDPKATFALSSCANQLAFISKPGDVAAFSNLWTSGVDLKYGNKPQCTSKNSDGGFDLIRDSENGRWLGLKGVGYENAWGACYDPVKYFPGNDGRWFITWLGVPKKANEKLPEKCVARFSLKANFV